MLTINTGMQINGIRRFVATLFVSCALLFTPACGGGSGTGGDGGDDGGGLQAPSNLVYALAAILVETDSAITPNVPTYDGDAPTTWAVNPALPAGIVMDPVTGVISGTPTTQTPATNHTINCFNDAGGDDTQVSVQIDWTDEKSIAAKALVTDDDLRHFFHRTHLGFSQPHWDALQVMIADPQVGNGNVAAGLAAFVDAMTDLQQDAPLEAQAKTDFLVDNNDPTGEFPSQAQIANYWIALTLRNTNPFQEVLALHWHDHFATSTDALPGNGQRHYYEDHINLWRNHATGAGNLQTMLLDMALDWTMLEWLDGVRNNAGGNNEPNENFGREWLELFTLGVDVLYDQADIVEASRAFSGMQSFFDQNTSQNFIAPNINRHDVGAKTVLGVLIPAGQTVQEDFESVVDITINAVDPAHGRSACGRWIVRQLLRRFVYDNPPENVINELTEILENNNWDMKQMLQTLFVSEAFFSQRAKTDQFATTPTEAMVLFQRITTIPVSTTQMRARLFLMGNLQSLPPVVDGWPEGAAWFSSQGMIDRANLFEYMLRSANQIDLRDILPAAPTTTPAIVDSLTTRMRVDLTPAERTQLVNYMDSDYDNGTATADPFDINNQLHINERVRGALYILAQHPTALSR